MAPNVRTALMNVSYYWSANTGVSMCRSLQEIVANEFVLTSPAVPACFAYLTWMVC